MVTAKGKSETSSLWHSRNGERKEKKEGGKFFFLYSNLLYCYSKTVPFCVQRSFKKKERAQQSEWRHPQKTIPPLPPPSYQPVSCTRCTKRPQRSTQRRRQQKENNCNRREIAHPKSPKVILGGQEQECQPPPTIISPSLFPLPPSFSFFCCVSE